MKNINITINKDTCKGCALCVEICPKNVLVLDESSINKKGYNPSKVENIENCIACAMCGIVCPDSVIKIEKG